MRSDTLQSFYKETVASVSSWFSCICQLSSVGRISRSHLLSLWYALFGAPNRLNCYSRSFEASSENGRSEIFVLFFRFIAITGIFLSNKQIKN